MIFFSKLFMLISQLNCTKKATEKRDSFACAIHPAHPGKRLPGCCSTFQEKVRNSFTITVRCKNPEPLKRPAGRTRMHANHQTVPQFARGPVPRPRSLADRGRIQRRPCIFRVTQGCELKPSPSPHLAATPRLTIGVGTCSIGRRSAR